MTTQIDYKKVFSKLSHIKALSHDQKFDQIVQNIITHALNHKEGNNPKTDKEVAKKVLEVYGISIRPNVILSNLDKLISSGEIVKDSLRREYILSIKAQNKINERLLKSNELEINVKTRWFEELTLFIPEINQEHHETMWICLESYLSTVLEQHGVQTLHFLNPATEINHTDQTNFVIIIEKINKKHNDLFSKETLSKAINQFIINADEIRTNYISQLVDATFTSFALTSDAETVSFLNKRYNNLRLFLDTNFIFGILDLHKNSEDGSAREILEEVKKNQLPFKLCYHPETLAEFKRAFSSKAMHVRATQWTRETSRIALAVDGLSPLEELFHKQNVENEIDPSIFLEKYDHVDLILKDLGLLEYIPTNTTDLEHGEIESDVSEYQRFYETTRARKEKYYLSFKHDIVVLREVRILNPKKTKFLESNSFFISSDFVLGKFEKKYYKRNWEINYVVSPSVFLQLIRPFIENDYASNKRFIDTFSIPELRAFEIDYSTTRSKTLQILNDNYHDTSFETKVKMLRDQVLLDKLQKAGEDNEKQNAIIENQIAIENQILMQQKTEAEKTIKQFEEENKSLELLKIEAEEEAKLAINRSESLASQQTQVLTEISLKDSEIEVLKSQLDKEKAKTKHQQELFNWQTTKEQHVKTELLEKRTHYKKASLHCIRPTIILLSVAILSPIITKYYSELTIILPVWFILTLIVLLILVAGYDLLYRTYLADKEKIKDGLHWIGTLGFERKKIDLLEKHRTQIENAFILQSKKPELRN